jgi:hypothetical protein
MRGKGNERTSRLAGVDMYAKMITKDAFFWLLYVDLDSRWWRSLPLSTVCTISVLP